MSLQKRVTPPPTYVPKRSAAIARLGWETKSSDSLGWYAFVDAARETAASAGSPGPGSLITDEIPAPIPARSMGGSSAADFGNSVMGPPSSARKSRSEEHTSELQSRRDLVCRLLL